MVKRRKNKNKNSQNGSACTNQILMDRAVLTFPLNLKTSEVTAGGLCPSCTQVLRDDCAW